MNNPAKYSKLIKDACFEIGFDACGITKAAFLNEDAVRLKNWLDNSMHADMHYMANHFDKRTDASKLVPGAKSVVSVLLNYYTDEKQFDKDAPIVSKYALGNDYHKVIKKKLKQLYKFINENIVKTNGRFFVDSAPLLEKSYAQKAGLGWIGKNSCLINKKYGSFVFIGELVLDLELQYDNEHYNHCGNCTRCIDACPTKAIIKPRVIDARKCISYLTIEHKGDLNEIKDINLHNRIFGCDICQDVCPWNKKLTPHNVTELQPNKDLLNLTKEQWKQLSKEQFNLIFKNSPVKRIGYENLIRNINILKDD
ncbi:MAG: tRNA epoxyqueuosine(34) reductase QueG [Marinilabiliales bacterium]